MHAMEAKGLTSPLQGDSDVLIMPDIEAGNVFYKAITLFAGASTAGLLLGAKCPAVVPSRADSAQSKFYSLAVATMAAE
jgi:phosphate butyryltransferase